jgi:DNA segregation ATPase FtsK/SpoIIIE-like protein
MPAAPVEADAGPPAISETQFVEETLSPPEIELAPEPGEEPSPADEVLAKLFGEPVPAPSPAVAAASIIEEAPAPAGPVQPEPREPPANLQPIIEEVVERVTLLNDPDLPDCARDHGIDTGPILDDPVFLPPAELVVDVPAAVAADEVIEEPAVDEALVSRLVEEFRADAAPAPEAVVETPAAPAGADDLYAQAVAAVRERGRGSVIVLQRKLGIGYTRAVKILEELVRNGVVGPENASGSHPVL